VILVAEIRFNRDSSPDEFRRLGEVLTVCRENNSWIAAITGLEELLKGECPKGFSKALGNPETGEIIPIYDPILVWGRLDYPNKELINPVNILRNAIPPSLGRVADPDPDNGL
jgi:hypothetical protein